MRDQCHSPRRHKQLKEGVFNHSDGTAIMTKTRTGRGNLPIKIDSTSNGQFAPIPLDGPATAANRHALEKTGDDAKHAGLERRDFLASACGAASTLLAFNAANAAAGRTGGVYDLSGDAAHDSALADHVLGGDELIFDAQGYHGAPFRKARAATAQDSCFAPLESQVGYLRCLGSEEFIKDVFLDSDTDMMVLSFVPSTPEGEPLTIEEAAATREIVAKMAGSHRLMIHGRVNPNQPGDIDDMARRAAFGVAAWKTYTQWGPDGKGFYLTDADTGVPMIERARELDTPIIAIHKGIPFGQQSYQHSLCDDVGPAARLYPDTKFLIYHAGYIPGQPEGPYDPDRGEGVDSLIRSVLEHGNPENVYAELGSSWRFAMRDPDDAAHLLGKLLKYLGPDQILWGTDSIWYGSPQDQIQAMRSFQISPEFQDRYGYPEITPEIRAKIFGLNAVRAYGLDPDEVKKAVRRDAVQHARTDYRHAPDPHFRTHGPRNRREFLNLIRHNGGERA